jgi:uncharacterized protein YdaU (DUF1376 family)
MSTKPPAFQFYPKDYETDEHVKMMSLEQEGAFLRLLCHQWLTGSIPADRPAQAKLCRVPAGKMARLWPGVAPCFADAGEGRLMNPRMERQREAQARYSAERSQAGRRGAEKRHGSAIAQPSPSHSSATAKPKPPSATASATANGNGLAPAAQPPGEPWSREASDDWIAAKGGQPPGRIFPALKRAVGSFGWERVRPAWRFYLANTGSEFVVVDKFVAAFGEWEKRAAGGAPPGAKATPGNATLAAAARVMERQEGRGGR